MTPSLGAAGRGAAPESVADRLRIVQAKLGLKNDSQFAAHCQVSRSSMSGYLAAKQLPRRQVLIRIAKLAGVDPAWLTDGTPSEPVSSKVLNYFSGEIFDDAALSAPVNFNLLVQGIAACRESFEGQPRPTLRETLQWVAVHTYTLYNKIPDLRFRIIPEED